MKILIEEYQKALSIVIQYESENYKNERETLKRENYNKPLREFAPKGTIRFFNDIVFKLKGFNPEMTVGEFFLLDIDFNTCLKEKSLGNVERKRIKTFLDEYKLK